MFTSIAGNDTRSQPGTALTLRRFLRSGVELVDPAQMMQRALECSEARIAPISVLAIGQMQHVRNADRRELHLARPAAAHRLVALIHISEPTRLLSISYAVF